MKKSKSIFKKIGNFFKVLILGIAALVVFVIALPFIIISSVVHGIKYLVSSTYRRNYRETRLSIKDIVNSFKEYKNAKVAC